MYKHTTDEVVMIRPERFYGNEETAVNNAYQNTSDESVDSIQAKAIKEFDDLKAMLEAKGVKVNVLQDTPTPSTPDSIFPNNWFSSHEGGLMCVYPMFAENRQAEIAKFRPTVEGIAQAKAGNETFFRVIDFSRNHSNAKVLEGTGSIVIDRKARVAYSCLSPRADKDLFVKWCEETNHTPVYFHAEQDGTPVYHTNVIMGIGSKSAIVCLDSIVDEKERAMVKESLEKTNKVIEITLEQVKLFLGNNLELKGKDGNFVAMSETAYQALTEEQKAAILEDTEILHAPIETIEFYGGGSVRCMIAEIFA